MGRMLNITGVRTLAFQDYEDRRLSSDEVRIKTLFSGISAGTQLTLYRGKNPYISKHFDRKLRIFVDGEQPDPYPIPGAWAYEEVGAVCEIGAAVTDLQIGDHVYGAWGHRSTHIMRASDARQQVLKDSIAPIAGVFAQIGATALNAVLDANIHIGDVVAVFGQGVPGQIAAQLARLNGADVIAVDLNEERLAQAKKMGAKVCLNPSSCDAAKEIKLLTQGGADKCIEISGSSAALHQAIRSCSYGGQVICVGFMPGEATGLVLGEEFHHNRIQLISSQIEGLGVHVKNTWSRKRLDDTIMRLYADRKLDLEGLITHKVAFKDAPGAYRMLDTSTDCLQVVLCF